MGYMMFKKYLEINSDHLIVETFGQKTESDEDDKCQNQGGSVVWIYSAPLWFLYLGSLYSTGYTSWSHMHELWWRWHDSRGAQCCSFWWYTASWERWWCLSNRSKLETTLEGHELCVLSLWFLLQPGLVPAHLALCSLLWDIVFCVHCVLPCRNCGVY